MKLGNTPHRWGAVARIFHWVLAVLVAAQLILGWRQAYLQDDDPAGSTAVLFIHYQLGILMLALVLMRLAWRIANPAPEPLPSEPGWRRRVADGVHWTFYGLLLAMPVTGYVVWAHMSPYVRIDAPMDVFGLFTVPMLFTPPEDDTLRIWTSYAHQYFSWALVGLIGLHLSAAAWHQFVVKDRILDRMLT
jgi:cytochrome b561